MNLVPIRVFANREQVHSFHLAFSAFAALV